MHQRQEAVQLAGEELATDDVLGRIFNPTVERVSRSMASASRCGSYTKQKRHWRLLTARVDEIEELYVEHPPSCP